MHEDCFALLQSRAEELTTQLRAVSRLAPPREAELLDMCNLLILNALHLALSLLSSPFPKNKR